MIRLWWNSTFTKPTLKHVDRFSKRYVMSAKSILKIGYQHSILISFPFHTCLLKCTLKRKIDNLSPLFKARITFTKLKVDGS